ncbi:MAG: hypothetical protein RIC84_14060 [Aggregatilineales bacterium]
MTLLRRIAIIGSSGSGKSTLGKQLADLFGTIHVELDALHWLPDWQMENTDIFRQKVTDALSGERWVVDGNYSKVRDVVWSRADTIVWLDYPLRIVYWRLFWRTMKRTLLRENLWESGNTESLYNQFMTRDSLFVWAWTSKARQQKMYPELLSQPEYAHLTVYKFRYPKQTAQWLITHIGE